MTSRLKELRIEKGITQRELAELAGIPIRAIQVYEQGYRPLGGASAEVVYKIANALGTTVEHLLGYER